MRIHTGLTSITIPDTVKTIGEKAFVHNALKTVTIGKGIMDINKGAAGAFSTDTTASAKYGGPSALTKVIMTEKLHAALNTLGKLGDGTIFKFKGGTTKYVDSADGTTELK